MIHYGTSHEDRRGDPLWEIVFNKNRKLFGKILIVASMKGMLNRNLLMKSEQMETGIFNGFPFSRRKYILHYNSRVSLSCMIYDVSLV